MSDDLGITDDVNRCPTCGHPRMESKEIGCVVQACKKLTADVEHALNSAKFVYEGQPMGLECENYIRVQLQVAGWNL